MLIKNARDYEGRICDYLIADGKIRAIGTDLPEAGEVINAKGLTILPAFIDTHCHWRTPGFEYKEDIATGSAAAAAAAAEAAAARDADEPWTVRIGGQGGGERGAGQQDGAEGEAERH